MDEYSLSMIDNIKHFIKQFTDSNDKIDINAYINYYRGLNVTPSFGVGNLAFVPFISFLGGNQTTQKGIYPVILFYRLKNTIILSYGKSVKNHPSIEWNLLNPQTIETYFEENKISGFRTKEKAYFNSYVYKVYRLDSLDFNDLVTDLNSLIDIYKSILIKNGEESIVDFKRPPRSKDIKREKFDLNNYTLSESTHNMNFSIERICKEISSTGLIYSETLIKRFTYSLLTKPFVILSGLAGSGKTQLALAFAKILSEDSDDQICFVPVGADWTNREPLLGYPNAITNNEYVLPESGVLQLILKASKNLHKPYFIILDEMNLSYVERYFADFLSAMEAKNMKIKLWDVDTQDVPRGISLPRNLFIIGTINVDETTYMFSPKVLDRASVIEFKVDEIDMDKFLTISPNVDVDLVQGNEASMAKNFVEKSNTKIEVNTEAIKSTLIDFFTKLKKVNAEFGYRTATEIARFIALATEDKGLTMDEAVDAAIVQKLLPKLHGSRKKLDGTLKALWSLCMKKECDVSLEQKYYSPDLEIQCLYKLSADKILRMYSTAIDNGFTSFAEA